MNKLPKPASGTPCPADEYPVPEEIEAAQGAVSGAFLLAYCVGRPIGSPREAELPMLMRAWPP